MAVFLQRWPSYLRLPNQANLGEEFIRIQTSFVGPWQPVSRKNPRGINVADIDDCQMGEIIEGVLREKGYMPFLQEISPRPAGRLTVEEIMAQNEAVNPQFDACLFCFYAPMVFLSHRQDARSICQNRAYALQEIVQALNPGGEWVIWSGPRASLGPKGSISHAFIYISMTMFKAHGWQPLWEVADSMTAGRLMVKLIQCPPGPTDKNYKADAAMIQRLMVDNLACRLHHLIPDPF